MIHNFKAVLIIGFSATLTACGGVPDCDSSDVVKDLKNQLLAQVRNSQAGMYTGGIMGAINSEGAYEKLQVMAKSNAEAQNALAELDKGLAGLKLDLANIRPVSVDDKVSKAVCAADIAMSSGNGNESQPIGYSAQKTKDGLRVEISSFGQ